MGYSKFMTFIDRVAHVNPGFKFKPDARRHYQKVATNVIFANQVLTMAAISDENPVKCNHGGYVAFMIISGCIIFVLLVIIYALRQTCHELQDKLRRPVMVPMTVVPTVPPPPPMMTGPSPYRPMVITTIAEEDEAAPDENRPSVVLTGDEFIVDQIPDTPPSYSSLQIPGNSAETPELENDNNNIEMGSATAPNESGVDPVDRPYPLMLPNNYQVDQPIVVATAD